MGGGEPVEGGDTFPNALVAGSGDALAAQVARWGDRDLTVRVVRGRAMRTLSGLFDEFAAVLAFPPYFGKNKDAFDECLADLEDLSPEGLVLVLTEPHQILIDADEVDLRWFLEVLRTASDELARSIGLGEMWDRPAVPVHVVLAGTRGQLDVAVKRGWPPADPERTAHVVS
jgi:hypothetical protein